MSLPLETSAMSEPRFNSPEGSLARVARRSPPVRVLAVDDEPAIRAVFEVALRRAGYDVVAVDRGERALAELRAGRFDCVLLDFLIPDLRGDVIYAYAVGVQPHLAHGTVWVTGDITERTHNTLEGTGCPVLLKPFALEDLLRLVGDATRNAATGLTEATA
jgi:DNA-binding NtrC family response regulator